METKIDFQSDISFHGRSLETANYKFLFIFAAAPPFF